MSVERSEEENTQPPVLEGKFEVGRFGVWSVSSAKPGNGVAVLRDDNLVTFWQSDGIQPHSIEAAFDHIVSISDVYLYLDFHADESYTPRKVGVVAGYSVCDAREIVAAELNEPKGWMRISLAEEGGITASYVKILIRENHQNGRDSHVRQVRLLGPTTADTLTIVYPSDTVGPNDLPLVPLTVPKQPAFLR